MRRDGVAVVGSANLDVVMLVDRFAEPGETVLGDRLEQTAGGKGLNQAVAAARTAPCAFVGCVGDDEAGELLTARLADAGVDVTGVSRVEEPTGRAFIQVTPDAENSIVVMPLANRSLSPEMVTAALDAHRPAVVLAQLEIPLESVRAAADWATSHGSRFLLNPSPVQDLPEPLLAACDPVVLNVAEARSVLGALSAGPTTPVELARVLLQVSRSAVVTAGADGAAFASGGGPALHVSAVPTEPVDTTGAGDEFAGALAAVLATGHELADAVQRGTEAAARLVTTPRSQR